MSGCGGIKFCNQCEAIQKAMSQEDNTQSLDDSGVNNKVEDKGYRLCNCDGSGWHISIEDSQHGWTTHYINEESIKDMVTQQCIEARQNELVITCLAGMGGLTIEQQKFIEDRIEELKNG